MSKIESYNDVANKSTFLSTTFGSAREYDEIIAVIKEEVIKKIVNMYVDAYGDDIIASIDLETIKKKTNEKVTISALKELIK